MARRRQKMVARERRVKERLFVRFERFENNTNVPLTREHRIEDT